jgi:hypothetical protein
MPEIKLTPTGPAKEYPKTGDVSFTVDITVDGVGVGDYGWVIQKVTRKFRVYDCAGCDCARIKAAHFQDVTCTPHVEHGKTWVFDQTYLEAWQLYNGELFQGKRAPDANGAYTPGAKDTFSPGGWEGRVCGFFSCEGVLKFFTNAELAPWPMPLLNPPVWGQLEKVPASKLLPSTNDPDRIRQFDQSGVAATQRHYFEVTFDNCAGGDFNVTVVDVAPEPRMGAKEPREPGGRKRRK